MIELNNVTKYFGDYPAITDISFTVDDGEIVGFLGPNGAGKSTTMKIITGFLPPSAGKISVAGHDVVTDSLAARSNIGYLPETVPLYGEMTVKDYLTFMGKIRGMSRSKIRSRIDEVVDQCRLVDYRNSHISKLSKGFRQRVGIAQAILHEPKVLILDEPTIGIDPRQVIETRDLIESLGGDRTVLVSSHLLDEVERMCGRVIIIDHGSIKAEDTPENLQRRLRNMGRIEVHIKGPEDTVSSALSAIRGVENVALIADLGDGIRSYNIDTKRGDDVRARISSAIVEGKWALVHMESITMSLEEIFVEVTTALDSGEEPLEEDSIE
jgi:ABC-2 type transport system ATP-binding protein